MDVGPRRLQARAVVAADGPHADDGVAAHGVTVVPVHPYDAGMDDPLYFRQLLAGRDFARGDQIARQMVNFVYLVGDRRTGEAMVIDPAYDIAGLLDVVAADGMHLMGALATHYHPDHVGGDHGRPSIQGVRELLELAPVPVHVQADEAPWVTRVTDAGDDDLVAHASGDVVMVGAGPHRAHPHPRPHAGQPVLPGRQPPGGRRHALPRGLRAHRPARRRPGPALREPDPAAGQGARRRRAVPRPPLLGRAVGHHGRDPQVELRLAPRSEQEWLAMFGR